jgi:Ca2+-binding EF-hand superfamily protein
MLDQVFHVFDGDNQGSVSESEWILGLSVMLHGKLEEQIAFAYEVYDIDGDRRIGRKEITQCLGSCLHSAYMDDDELTAEEGTRELVDIVLRKMDKDRDGALKFRDFYKSIQTDPLLLQALGPCLPSEKAMMTFLTLIDTNCRNYKSYLSHPHDPSWIRERNKFAPPGSDRFLPKPLEPRRSKRLSSDPKLKSVFRYKNQSNSGDKDKRSEATS